jgi:hypothetical protein
MSSHSYEWLLFYGDKWYMTVVSSENKSKHTIIIVCLLNHAFVKTGSFIKTFC